MKDAHSYSIHMHVMELGKITEDPVQHISVEVMEDKNSLDAAIKYLARLDDRLFNLKFAISGCLSYCIYQATIMNERDEKIVTKQYYHNLEGSAFPSGTYLQFNRECIDAGRVSSVTATVRSIQQEVGTLKNFLLLTEQQLPGIIPVFPVSKQEKVILRKWKPNSKMQTTDPSMGRRRK